jgi:hypothetical protein
MDVPLLMPEPNLCRYRGGSLEIRRGDLVGIDTGVAQLVPDLPQRAARALGVVLDPCAAHEPCRIRFRVLGEDLSLFEGLAAEPHHRDGLKRPEAYGLVVGSEGITVAARDARGFLHALQTLRQLAARQDGGVGCLVQGAAVLDYPHLSARGLHLYLPAREELPFFRGLVEALALLKYNRLYFEVSGMELRRHPEINEAWRAYCRDMNEFPEKAKLYQNGSHRAGWPWYRNSIHVENAGGDVLSQAEVRDLVACCREHLIEVVPEVQSLSHCDYLVLAHREIAETPADAYPSSYCPSNPRTYELLFDVMDEVIEVFKPAMVNIGHDEWYTPCLCQACRTADAADLLAADVRRIHGYLAGRGISVEMWGDKLLDAHTPDGRGQGGAFRIVENYETSERLATMPSTWRAVDLIPKDIRVGNWYWWIEPGAFAWLARHGLHHAVYTNVWGPGLKDWRQQSRQSNVEGGTLSHWDAVDEETMARDGILANIVYSSWPLWNERYDDACWPTVRDRTIDFMPAFRAACRGRQGPVRDAAGRTAVRFPVRHEKRDQLYMDTPLIELRCHAEVSLRHGRNEGYDRQAQVTRRMRAQACRIAWVHDKVDGLVFTHATSFHAPFRSADKGWRLSDYLLGYYTVRYADGQETSLPLHYCGNVGPFDVGWGRKPSGCVFTESIELMQTMYRARPVLLATNASEAATAYAFEWGNPRPEEEISSLGLSLAEKEAPFSVWVYDVVGFREGRVRDVVAGAAR